MIEDADPLKMQIRFRALARSVNRALHHHWRELTWSHTSLLCYRERQERQQWIVGACSKSDWESWVD